MKVLIVDDNRLTRDGVSDYFAKIFPEFDRYRAADGREAIGYIEHEYFDLIVTDFQMPYASGVDVLIRAREVYKLKKARVLFMTLDPATLILEFKRRLGEEAAIDLENFILDKGASLKIEIFKSKVKKIMGWN